MYRLIIFVLAITISTTAFAQNDKTLAPKQETASSEAEEVFTFVEQMPEFDGNINEYIAANIRYPAEALKKETQGRVIIKLIIQKDGSVSDAKVLRGIGSGCDEEALRVVNSMPKWKAGKQNGKPVAVYYNLPLSFKVQ